MTGEVEVAGFSEYVHPLDADNLITIGRIRGNVQLQLFDVSRASPVRSPQEVVADYFNESAAGKDPRKFNFSQEYAIASFPIRPRDTRYNWYARYGQNKMLNYNASADEGITLNSEIVHNCRSGYYYAAPCARGQAEMLRTIVEEDVSFILSEVGVSAHQLPSYDLIDFTSFSSRVPFVVDITRPQEDGAGGAGGAGAINR